MRVQPEVGFAAENGNSAYEQKQPIDKLKCKQLHFTNNSANQTKSYLQLNTKQNIFDKYGSKINLL